MQLFSKQHLKTSCGTRFLIAVMLIFFGGGVFCQVTDDFYDSGKIQDIRITFKESNWQVILDSLFVHYGDSGRLVGDVSINGKLFEGAGVRYKGYSSWNTNEVKNPFNIDLDYTVANQTYEGHSKIKLSNVIHDPSFVREVLAYEIARKYMPASRANFARLYVNDSLIGLYTNVEAVDKKFAFRHFRTTTGSFFKGEPDKLIYPFGENANLAYSHGTDTSGYLPYYKMESDAGWVDLLNFIRVLNTHADSLDVVLNVDRALWMHAFNYTLLNLDSYVGYCQNYYLYQDENGRFNPIIWDLNMSFGSFRETDGSYNFLGLSIPKIKVLDPLGQTKFTVSPRPLLSRLLQNDTLSRMFLAHMRTIVEENFLNQSAYNRAKELQQQIDGYVQEDSHKFYTYQHFLTNVDTTVGGTGNMILYPGLKDLINARTNYLSTYPGFSGQPLIGEISHLPDKPEPGETTWITVAVSNASRVFLAYRFSHSDAFRMIPMLDDGNSQDGSANDGIFGAGITLQGTIIQYYLYAENDLAGVFSPARAAYEFYTLQPEVLQGALVINEVKSGSAEAIHDWVELLNTSDETINLTDLQLRLGLSTWSFPDTNLDPGQYLVVPADGTGGMHTSFTLISAPSSTLELLSAKGNILDSVPLDWPVDTKTFGRYPNGYGPFTYMLPSPGMNNQAGTTPGKGFRLYPNPAHENAVVEFVNEGSSYTLEVFDLSGQKRFRQSGNHQNTRALGVTINLTGYQGLFLVRLTIGGKTYTRKLVVI